MCFLLANQFLSLRKRFAAISQSQFLISDASLKMLGALPAITCLFSTTSTRRRSTSPRTANPHHLQQHIWRPLALAKVTNLIFEAFCTCLALPCTFPSAIEQDEEMS